VGITPNSFGIGAKVRVRGGAVPLQERELTAGGLYLSSSEPLLSFAAGAADSLLIEVRWRDGRRSSIPDARPNRLYEIHQTGAEPPPAPPLVDPAPPMFVDETDRLGHSHTEVGFDETARQLLLPNAFSQLGPGVSWYDLDADGDDDLMVGTGRTGRPAVYRNDAGRLVPAPVDLVAAGDLTTILAVPGPRGGTLLLLGQSSYEETTPAGSVGLPSVLALPLDARGRRSGPVAAAVPGDTASVGPLALADYDRDGDLDLFVGGRIYPGAYPLSPSSRLFRNDGSGRFTLDQESSAPLRHLGMVSAALFADLDGDGDPDLVLAVEWGPLKLLVNEGGRYRLASDSWGLGAAYSRRFGLAAGDFDQDGRLDVVGTSWGRNTRPTADSTRPLYLYFGNFDDDRSLDLLLAQDDPRRGGRTYPLAGFARLARAVPSIAQRVRTFHAYAAATVEDVLGPASPAAIRLGVNSLQHVLWLNRGDRFEPRPLPLVAQLAPAVAPVVADFDGDGHEDLVLSQNFFPTDLGTPRYDAGRSLLLLGDGAGSFTPVAGQASGLLVYGDQRGAAAADYDGDGRVDVAISQNGAATRLFRNRGARPGLGIRLEGPAGNPFAIGAQVRLRYGERWGPVREIQAGSGYWSQSSLTPLLGLSGRPVVVWVRWPDGRVSERGVPPDARRLTLRP
jgi:hypothetical protein